MSDDADLSFVIQGPVQAAPDRPQAEGITAQCLASVRKFFPRSRIILSSWEGQHVAGLDFDELVLSPDPGPVILRGPEGPLWKENLNRQLVSTRNGLRQVKTRRACKLRSDMRLLGRDFAEIDQKYPLRRSQDTVLSARVLTSASFFNRYAFWRPTVFHPSDFFHYGATEDLLKLWDLPLFRSWPEDPAAGRPLSVEHRWCERWWNALGHAAPIVLQDATSWAPAWQADWDRFIASNLIVLENEALGLDPGPRFRHRGQALKQMSFLEWRVLYNRYCGTVRSDDTLQFMLRYQLIRWFKTATVGLRGKAYQPDHLHSDAPARAHPK